MTNKAENEIRLPTPRGEVRIRSFCTPEEVRACAFDEAFGTHAQYKSLYTRRESLERDAAQPEANVVLALTDEDHIVGFGVLARPDAGERWAELGAGLMMEVRVIEVSRSWRGARIAPEIVTMLLSHPRIEEKIAYMVGYSWTWDLDGTGLKAQEYRQLLIRLFEPFGFQEYETNEPNICLKHENVFMCRVGRKVSDEVQDRFHWLRFGIAPKAKSLPSARGKDAGSIGLERSLFLPLREEDLTSLGIYYDWKSGRVAFRAAREWESDIDWSTYGRAFTVESPLTSNTASLAHRDTRDLFTRYGLSEYFDEVVELIKKGRHQGIECFYEPQRDIRMIHSMHNSTLGMNNLYHAVRCGAVSFDETGRDEMDLIVDALNHSRAMSFKCAGAQIPFGGSRLAILSNPIGPTDFASLGFVAYVLDRTRSFVVPGMGFPLELADTIRREGYSINAIGGFDSKIGPPGGPTAYGVYLALKEAAYFKLGTLNLAGKRIVVQGAGAVGYPLVEKYLIRENAAIFVADTSKARADRLVERLPGRVQALDPEEVYAFDADILMPCATSGTLDERTIPQLTYSIILGAANNTLKAVNQKEEIRLARMMEERGIFFQVDWLHNTAAIICGAEEYINRRKASLKNVIEKVERVCRDGVRENLKAASLLGLTPTEQAYRHFNSIIYR